MSDLTILFEGMVLFDGGLSNETELLNSCPEEFKGDNPWSEYVARVFYEECSTINWRWKTDSGKERAIRIAHLVSLLDSQTLNQEEIFSVAGWMLSEMLKEVPECVKSDDNGLDTLII